MKTPLREPGGNWLFGTRLDQYQETLQSLGWVLWVQDTVLISVRSAGCTFPRRRSDRIFRWQQHGNQWGSEGRSDSHHNWKDTPVWGSASWDINAMSQIYCSSLGLGGRKRQVSEHLHWFSLHICNIARALYCIWQERPPDNRRKRPENLSGNTKPVTGCLVICQSSSNVFHRTANNEATQAQEICVADLTTKEAILRIQSPVVHALLAPVLKSPKSMGKLLWAMQKGHWGEWRASFAGGKVLFLETLGLYVIRGLHRHMHLVKIAMTHLLGRYFFMRRLWTLCVSDWKMCSPWPQQSSLMAPATTRCQEAMDFAIEHAVVDFTEIKPISGESSICW